MDVQEGPAVNFHGFEKPSCHVLSSAFPWDVTEMHLRDFRAPKVLGQDAGPCYRNFLLGGFGVGF